jgi:hypothetical protein
MGGMLLTDNSIPATVGIERYALQEKFGGMQDTFCNLVQQTIPMP